MPKVRRILAKSGYKAAFNQSASRRRLIRAGATLFAKKGYEATSVREIVEKAGFTKPTLYYYFGSKKGLCEAMVKEGLEALRGNLDRALSIAGPLRDRLREVLWAHFQFCLQNRELTRFFHSLVFGPPQRIPTIDFKRYGHMCCDEIAELLRKEAARGNIVKGRTQEVARILLGVITIYITHQLNERRTLLSRNLAALIVGVVLDGIAKRPRA